MRMRTITLVLIVVGVIGGLAWYSTTPAPFTLQVVSRPSSPPGQSEYIQSFAGQRCVFLVVVMEDEGWLQERGLWGRCQYFRHRVQRNGDDNCPSSDDKAWIRR
jgi:hypothetical protein